MSGGLSDQEWLLIRLPVIAERSTRINIDIKFVLGDLNVRGLRGIVSLLALFTWRERTSTMARAPYEQTASVTYIKLQSISFICREPRDIKICVVYMETGTQARWWFQLHSRYYDGVCHLTDTLKLSKRATTSVALILHMYAKPLALKRRA